jgi:hypothetical protein
VQAPTLRGDYRLCYVHTDQLGKHPIEPVTVSKTDYATAFSTTQTPGRTPALWRFLTDQRGAINCIGYWSFNPALSRMPTGPGCVAQGISMVPLRKTEKPAAFPQRAVNLSFSYSQCSQRRVVTSRVRNNACSNSTAEAEPTYATARHICGGYCAAKTQKPSVQ